MKTIFSLIFLTGYNQENIEWIDYEHMWPDVEFRVVRIEYKKAPDNSEYGGIKAFCGLSQFETTYRKDGSFKSFEAVKVGSLIKIGDCTRGFCWITYTHLVQFSVFDYPSNSQGCYFLTQLAHSNGTINGNIERSYSLSPIQVVVPTVGAFTIKICYR